MTQTLPLTSINHLAREVADVEKSVAFYRDVLGFRSITRPGFHFRGAWLYGYGVQLHIIEGQVSPPGPAISPRADHVAFHTQDIEGVESALRANKINYLRNVQGPTGMIQIFFLDPDGNHIEVAHYPSHPDVS